MNGKKLQALFLAGVFLAIAALTGMVYAEPKVNIGGYLQNTTAVRLHGDHEVLWCENRFSIDVDVELFPGKVYFYFSGLLFYDSVYDMHDSGFLKEHADRTVLRNEMGTPVNHTMSEYVRECYLDLYLEHFDIRLGKQQIVWGETDLFPMLDIINPQDLRHLNLESFEDMRIPLWSAKIDWNLTLNTALQLVLVPDVEPFIIAPFFSSHPFVPKGFRAPAPVPLVWHKVGRSLSNMEWGFRWYQNFGSFNYSLNFFRHWGDSPWSAIKLFRSGQRPYFFPRLDLRYKRMYSVGGSFAWNFTKLLGMKNVVIRFESVVNLETGQPALDYGLGGIPITVRSDNFKYCLALDKTIRLFPKIFPSGLEAMFHIFQTYILDYEDDRQGVSMVHPQANSATSVVHEDEVDTLLMVIFSTFYLPGEYLNPQAVVAYHDDGDFEIVTMLNYQHGDHLTFQLRANIFTGSSNDFLGEFRKASNIWFRVKYGF